MNIKKFFKEFFERPPKQYYTYKMLCKSCDLIFVKTNVYDSRCPMCGRRMEVYDAIPLEGKIYDNRA